MKSFITRVELHNADRGDYDLLHEYMRAANFVTNISDAGGRLFALPTATYYSQSDSLTADGVRDIARSAAARTGKNHLVITTEGVSSWFLSQINK